MVKKEDLEKEIAFLKKKKELDLKIKELEDKIYKSRSKLKTLQGG